MPTRYIPKLALAALLACVCPVFANDAAVNVPALGLRNADEAGTPWSAPATPYIVLHVLPTPVPPGAAALARAIAEQGPTLAGVSHVFVTREADAARGFVASLGAVSVAVVQDAAGAVAALNSASPAGAFSIVLSREGAVLATINGAGADVPAWNAVVDAVAAATRRPALSDYNIPKPGAPAVEGYDVVAYHVDSKPEKGKAQWSSAYRGVTYHFASAQHRALFAADPERYLPTYGGWCASAMGAKGTKVEIDPKNFKVKDGRLHLFYKDLFNDALKDWDKHEREWEPAADSNWKKLTGEAPGVGTQSNATKGSTR